MLAFIILAVKDFVPNAVAGFIIYQKKKIKVNDIIQVNNIEGKVIELALLDTKIKVKSNDIVFIPNSLLIKSEVKIIKKR